MLNRVDIIVGDQHVWISDLVDEGNFVYGPFHCGGTFLQSCIVFFHIANVGWRLCKISQILIYWLLALVVFNLLTGTICQVFLLICARLWHDKTVHWGHILICLMHLNMFARVIQTTLASIGHAIFRDYHFLILGNVIWLLMLLVVISDESWWRQECCPITLTLRFEVSL